MFVTVEQKPLPKAAELPEMPKPMRDNIKSLQSSLRMSVNLKLK